MNSNSETPEIQIQTPQTDAEDLRQIAEYMLTEFTPEDVQIFKEWRLWCQVVAEKDAFANFGLIYASKFHYRLIHRMNEFANSTNVRFDDLVSEMHGMLGDIENPEEIKIRIRSTILFFQNHPDSYSPVSVVPQSVPQSVPQAIPQPEPAPASAPPQSGAPENVRHLVNEVVCPYSRTISSNPPPAEQPDAQSSDETGENDEYEVAREEDIIDEANPGDFRFERLKDRIAAIPWVDESDLCIFQEACHFLDELPTEQIPVIADLVNYTCHENREEFARLAARHGEVFQLLNDRLKEISESLVCPLKHLKVIMAISLEG